MSAAAFEEADAAVVAAQAVFDAAKARLDAAKVRLDAAKAHRDGLGMVNFLPGKLQKNPRDPHRALILNLVPHLKRPAEYNTTYHPHVLGILSALDGDGTYLRWHRGRTRREWYEVKGGFEKLGFSFDQEIYETKTSGCRGNCDEHAYCCDDCTPPTREPDTHTRYRYKMTVTPPSGDTGKVEVG